MRPFLNFFGRSPGGRISSIFVKKPFLIFDFAVWTAKSGRIRPFSYGLPADEGVSSAEPNGRFLKVYEKITIDIFDFIY
jgi:hypothetical protein